MSRVAALLLALALCGCGGPSASAPSGEEPRRYADDEGSTRPSPDECALPLEQRTSGWYCVEAE
jgi:hypothetical protein